MTCFVTVVMYSKRKGKVHVFSHITISLLMSFKTINCVNVSPKLPKTTMFSQRQKYLS